MANLEEKIVAITNLMQQGILTGDEFSKIVQVLSNPNASTSPSEKTPLEKKYDDCFQNHIINVFRSPSTCKWPPLEESMVKEGTVNILEGWSYKPKEIRYIDTYIDASNGFGAMLRKKLRIVIDGDGNMQMVLEKVELGGIIGALSSDMDNWAPLAGVEL